MRPVTVLLPTCGRVSMLPDAVASVFAQDTDDWRLIICDNASDDDTAAYLATILEPRITVLRFAERADDGGKASHTALMEAWGGDGYAMLLHDDDMMHRSRVRVMAEAMERDGLGLAFSSMLTFDDATAHLARAGTLGGDPWRCDPSVYHLGIDHIIGNTTTPTACFDASMPSFPEGDYLLGAQDTLWWLDAATSGMRLGFVDSPLYYYRMHPAQHSRAFGRYGDARRDYEMQLIHDTAAALLRDRLGQD